MTGEVRQIRIPASMSQGLLVLMVITTALLPLISMIPLWMCPVCHRDMPGGRDCRWCGGRGKVGLYRKWYGSYLLSLERG
jgi:hypothetical protein